MTSRILTGAAGTLVLTASLAGCGTILGAPPAAQFGAPASTAADVPTSPSASSPAISTTCRIGYTPVDEPSPFVAGPAPSTSPGILAWDYPSVQVAVTVPMSDGGPVDVDSLTVVYYAANGIELGSGGLPMGQVIMPGQTLATVPQDDLSVTDPASCTVISWTPGN